MVTTLCKYANNCGMEGSCRVAIPVFTSACVAVQYPKLLRRHVQLFNLFMLPDKLRHCFVWDAKNERYLYKIDPYLRRQDIVIVAGDTTQCPQSTCRTPPTITLTKLHVLA